jgi:c-di-GMP-binding flagellar brake protein YcgR
MSHSHDERRSRNRIPARLPVKITAAGSPPQTGHTRDLSAGGVFLYTDANVVEGSELEMILILPPELTQGEKRWACCQASVVRVEPAGKDGNFGLAASIRRFELMPEIPG